MKTVRQTVEKRAWWGPVESEVSNERTMVRMRAGVLVELWCPWWREGGFSQLLTMLRGLPMLVDGESRMSLRLPQRTVVVVGAGWSVAVREEPISRDDTHLLRCGPDR